MTSNISRRAALSTLLAAPLSLQGAEPWTPLFDGRSLDGWKASEHADTFRVQDGAIVARGDRAHLFYVGTVENAQFRNFELRVEAQTSPGANSGVYFHTAFQKEGWPKQGFEVQLNNTATGDGEYVENKKTGSLYGVRNVYKQLAGDDDWMELYIAVRGRSVQVRLNGELLVDFVEPKPPVRAKGIPGRTLGSGTFALQGHDPGSEVRFRRIEVRPLPDSAKGEGPPPEADAVYQALLEMSARNIPVVDYHVHLKGRLTLEEALANSRRLGVGYGVAVNCGVGFPVQTDAGALEFLSQLKGKPVYGAMQAEGREWVNLFKPETVAQFDYVFTDSMTFTDDAGKRMRLWIPEEVGEIGDVERFMETLVDRTVGILNNEPIDIYVNPTFLPAVIAADYDRLWTPSRMRQVIEAAKANDVAVEINNRYELPSGTFIKAAKKAGLKFAFGTNNTDRNLGRLEYGIRMVRECGLGWRDFFVPRPDGEKPIQRKGFG